MTRAPVVTRRKALFLAGIAAATPSTLLASDSIKTGVHGELGSVSMPRSAIAKTQYGPVRVLGHVCLHRQAQRGRRRMQPTDPDANRTMILDNQGRMVNDPDGNARKIILA